MDNNSLSHCEQHFWQIKETFTHDTHKEEIMLGHG